MGKSRANTLQRMLWFAVWLLSACGIGALSVSHRRHLATASDSALSVVARASLSQTAPLTTFRSGDYLLRVLPLAIKSAVEAK